MQVINQVQFMNTEDIRFMYRALELAELGKYSTSPNPRVGCVVVNNGQIVGEGFHLKAGEAHAEVHALQQANHWAKGATVYVTLEPCSHYGRTPPCVDALIDAKVARVVVAMKDPNPLVAGKGLARLIDAGADVSCGILEKQARSLNRGFLSRIERNRPFVCLKTAVSLDSKIALSDGRSQWITGDLARKDVQELRAQSCAVLTGIETILSDNPRLNVREFATFRQPVRVILDSQFRLPENSNVVQDCGATWVFTRSSIPSWVEKYPNLRIFTQSIDQNKCSKIHLPSMLHRLAQEGIGQVLLEAGSTLQSAFLEQGYVDEIVIYQSSKLLGQEGRSAFMLPENNQVLQQPSVWQTVSVMQLDNDIKWLLRHSETIQQYG